MNSNACNTYRFLEIVDLKYFTKLELLINIPFTGDVKLKGLIVIGGEDDTHPDKVGIHLNP